MEGKNKSLSWFNIILVSIIALIGGYYLGPYYFEKKDIAVYSPIIFFAIALMANIIGILLYKYSKNKSGWLIIKNLLLIALITGSFSFLAVKYYLHLKYIYLAALMLGLGTAIIFAVVIYKIKEKDNILPYILSILAVLVMFLGKRLLGDYGIFLIGIGALSPSYLLLYLYLKESIEEEYVSKIFKIIILISAGCFSWGLLQISMRRIGIADFGINLNHSYTFLCLYFGIMIPILMKNFLSNYLSLNIKPKVVLIALISLIPLLIGMVISSTSIVSYITAYLFTFMIVGFLLSEDVMQLIPPFLLTYVVVVFSPPLFEMFDNFKRLTRVGVFLGILVVFLLLYKYVFKKYLLCSSNA